MLKHRQFVLAIILICAPSAFAAERVAETGQTLTLTLNLLTAKPGSWVRRVAPHGHAYTTYVADVSPEKTIVHLIHSRHNRVLRNDAFHVLATEIREKGLDPGSAKARDAVIVHKGKTYHTKAISAQVGDSTGIYHITDEIPANGILCIEVHATQDGNASFTLWNDEYGLEPDRLIRKALHGEGKSTVSP